MVSSNALQFQYFYDFKKCFQTIFSQLKLVSTIFKQIFIFHQMIALQKLWKMFFISSKKLFLFSRYLNFCISIFPFFFPVSHCFRAWSKINLKFYDIINCLNKNFLFDILRRKKGMTFKLCPLIEYILKNHAENVHQKIVPDHFSILVNNPK